MENDGFIYIVKTMPPASGKPDSGMENRFADKVITCKRATSQSNAACGLFEKSGAKTFELSIVSPELPELHLW